MISLTTSQSPDTGDVQRICALTNRVLRNLEITDCYARLSAAMQRRTHGRANWCTFATWASRQAGSTIRGEDLLKNLERHLRRRNWLLAPVASFSRLLLRKGLFEPTTRLGRAVAAIHTPFDAFERTSDAVARGNLAVFSEIGHEFARLLETVPEQASVDSPEFEVFLNGLRPGGPPEGQDLLKHAFTHYQQQMHQEDATLHAPLVLLANLEIGLHEQTRLQPQIAEAVEAPFTTAEDLGKRVLEALAPGAQRWPSMIHRPLVTVLGWIAGRVRAAGTRVTREVVTEALMVLALPDAVLLLGQDLRAPVPPIFAQGRHAELDTFTSSYDPCAPGEDRCGASDWSNLQERMHYILHLFRAYAETTALFSPPFTADQVHRFRAGHIPDGDL